MRTVAKSVTPDVALRVGTRIRSRREELGLTLDDMASKTGFDKSRLSKIERGESETSLERYEAIALVLDTKLDELFRQ